MASRATRSSVFSVPSLFVGAAAGLVLGMAGSKYLETQVGGGKAGETAASAAVAVVTVPKETPAPVEYGYPSYENLKFYDYYVSSYDRRNKTAHWSAECISKETLKRGDDVNRKGSRFFEDDTEPEVFRAKLSDYRRSGYDRGHLVPSGSAKHSQVAMNQTFSLSNMSPQVGKGFNRDYWARLEEFCRGLVKVGAVDRAFVVTGPLYLPAQDEETGDWIVTHKMIGDPPNVSVPTHFFKAVLTEKVNDKTGAATLTIGAFSLPNAPIPDGEPLAKYAISVDELERVSGLSFFPKVDRTEAEALRLCDEVACVLPEPNFWMRGKRSSGKSKDKADPKGGGKGEETEAGAAKATATA